MLYPQFTRTRTVYDINGIWNFRLLDLVNIILQKIYLLQK